MRWVLLIHLFTMGPDKAPLMVKEYFDNRANCNSAAKVLKMVHRVYSLPAGLFVCMKVTWEKGA